MSEESKDQLAEGVVDAILDDLRERLGDERIPELIEGWDVVRARWLDFFGSQTSILRLTPFVQSGSLLVIAEPNGELGALVFRPTDDPDTIERVGHDVNFSWGHVGDEQTPYVKKLTIKISDAPGRYGDDS